MSENTLPAQHQPSLADVIKKIRNTDFPYAVNEKWEKEYLDDKHKKKYTKLTFINKNFTHEEQSVLLNASAQDLCDALINTQPQTIDWSLDNPYIKWPLAASLCVAGGLMCSAPWTAIPAIMSAETAEMYGIAGICPCILGGINCLDTSNIQHYYYLHGIDHKTIDTQHSAPLYNSKYKGRTLYDYEHKMTTNNKIYASKFIRLIKDLSQYRVHNGADKDALLHVLQTMKTLQYTPPTQEDIGTNGYDKSSTNINNNESETHLKNDAQLIK